MKEIDYLKNFDKTSVIATLKRINLLLDYLDNPQDNLDFIHIAGTNGKGSIAEILTVIYKEAGYNIGTFTSPGVMDLKERIRINDRMISNQELAELVKNIKPHINRVARELEHPTFFEIITAIAFCYFSNKNLDLVVLETGMGGRLDATNVVDSMISVITNVGLDHTEYLGDTIEEIAKEKAGIIKPKQKVITAAQKAVVLETLEEKAAKEKAELININQKYFWEKTDFNHKNQSFNLKGPDCTLNNLKISLLGRYQILNTVTALAVIEELNKMFYVSEKDIRKALIHITWPGRLEVVKEKPLIILDGSHNLEGIKNLNKELNRFKYSKLIILISIFSDKNIKNMIEELEKKGDHFILTQNRSKRAVKAETLKKYIVDDKKAVIRNNLELGLNYALDISKEDDLILITGSLHNVTELRHKFTGGYN
ncbi:MAG TPA: folylpolyglutamate synthase/dihydrofolate synthase family protein [Halanaerobiales bacterium]|nr:folylpolyglutamate synthase/dihydrofolate synthase family protein [Halanaerobiales bacterium]